MRSFDRDLDRGRAREHECGDARSSADVRVFEPRQRGVLIFRSGAHSCGQTVKIDAVGRRARAVDFAPTTPPATSAPRVAAHRDRARGATATRGVDGARIDGEGVVVVIDRHRHRARAKRASKRRRGVARARRIARAHCRAVAARAFRDVDRGALDARARARRRRRASETDEGNISASRVRAAIARGRAATRARHRVANDASVSFGFRWTIGGLI